MRMAVNNGESPHAESRSCHVPTSRQQEFMSVRRLAVQDSRDYDRKEKETLNQKGTSLSSPIGRWQCNNGR